MIRKEMTSERQDLKGPKVFMPDEHDQTDAIAKEARSRKIGQSIAVVTDGWHFMMHVAMEGSGGWALPDWAICGLLQGKSRAKKMAEVSAFSRG